MKDEHGRDGSTAAGMVVNSSGAYVCDFFFVDYPECAQ